jgi:hypothetical protein
MRRVIPCYSIIVAACFLVLMGSQMKFVSFMTRDEIDRTKTNCKRFLLRTVLFLFALKCIQKPCLLRCLLFGFLTFLVPLEIKK